MKHLFENWGYIQARIQQAQNLFLFLDYDGTLTPIVSRPELALCPSEVRRHLEKLRDLPRVYLAIISGRSLEDLREKVGVSGIIYVGNHGLEIENPVGRHNDNWSLWFKDWLHSRYYTKRASKTGAEDKVFAEGVVFYNLKRKAASQSWMAKLRRDMFDWFYSDKIAILDYDKAGRDVTEDQEKFE